MLVRSEQALRPLRDGWSWTGSRVLTSVWNAIIVPMRK
jgi:hypothetical protein